MALSLFCRAGLQAGRRCAVQVPVHAAYPSRSMVSTPCAAVCVPGARVLPTCGPNAQVQVRRVSLALPVPVVSSLPAACAPLAPTPLGPMVGTLSPWAGQAGFASSVAAPAALSKRESLEDKLERWDNLTQEFLAYETAPSLDNLADRAIHLMREVGKDAPGMGKRMGKAWPELLPPNFRQSLNKLADFLVLNREFELCIKINLELLKVLKKIYRATKTPFDFIQVVETMAREVNIHRELLGLQEDLREQRHQQPADKDVEKKEQADVAKRLTALVRDFPKLRGMLKDVDDGQLFEPESPSLNDPTVVMFFSHVSRVYCEAGRHKMAISVAEKYLCPDADSTPVDENKATLIDARVSAGFNSIALAWYLQDKFDTAEKFWNRAVDRLRALEKFQRGDPSNPPVAVIEACFRGLVSSVSNLATCLVQSGHADRSLGLLGTYIHVVQEGLAANHTEVLFLHQQQVLSFLHMELYQSAEDAAKPLLAAVPSFDIEQALDEPVASNNRNPNQPYASAPVSVDAAVLYHDTASFFAQNGRSAIAAEFIKRCISIRKVYGHTADYLTGSLWNDLGMMVLNGGDFELARRCMLRGLQMKADVVGAQAVEMAQPHINVAQSYFEQKRYEQAEEHLNTSFSILTRHGQGEEPNFVLAECLSLLGQVHTGKGDIDTAIAVTQRAAEMRQVLLGAHDEVSAEYARLGLLLTRESKFARAVEAHRMMHMVTLEVNENKLDSPPVAASSFTLATSFESVGNEDEAYKYYNQAMPGLSRCLGQAEYVQCLNRFQGFLSSTNRMEEAERVQAMVYDIMAEIRQRGKADDERSATTAGGRKIVSAINNVYASQQKFEAEYGSLNDPADQVDPDVVEEQKRLQEQPPQPPQN